MENYGCPAAIFFVTSHEARNTRTRGGNSFAATTHHAALAQSTCTGAAEDTRVRWQLLLP